MAPSTFRRRPTLVTLATAYAEQADAPDTLVIPEDLTALSDEERESQTQGLTEQRDAMLKAAMDRLTGKSSPVQA